MHDFMHDLAAKVAGFECTKVDREGLGISDLTRHVSYEIELDLSQQIRKHLRTLMFLGGKWNERAWESICRDFRLLRVLDLHGLEIKGVSPLIQKFKHLKYLDLSNNEMEALPNSITNLVNLQVLKLNGCRRLKALPRDINKLINLRHLDIGCSLDYDLCERLEYMPCGIGKLTSLQTLSCFVVAKNIRRHKMVGGLDELGRLNELRGSLEIRVWLCDRNSCISEFEGAKLIEKKHLQSLTIGVEFDRTEAQGMLSGIDLGSFIRALSNGRLRGDLSGVLRRELSDSDLHDKMLQSLQPPSNLQYLSVVGYGGMRLPIWLSDLTNLVKIHIEDCWRLKHIPPLDGNPYLEELQIKNLRNLEYIDIEGVGVRGVSTFFSFLKKLRIGNCPSLKGWWKKSDVNDNDDSGKSTTTKAPTKEESMMPCFPCLSSLKIDNCPQLSSMPLFPSLEEDLSLFKSSSGPLHQTMKMTASKTPTSISSSSSSSSLMTCPLSKLKQLLIDSIEDLESLPKDGLQNLSSLEKLSIWRCPRLKSLPLPDQGMHSLQKLGIVGCGELRSLTESPSQGIPHLPFLKELYIKECSEELKGRIRRGKEDVEYWANINRIPTIIIDGYSIQRDGRYVKEENLKFSSFWF